MQSYHSLINSDTKLDHNSCTVVASTLAFDQEYNEMLAHYDQQGRQRRRGVKPTETRRINLELAQKFNYGTKCFNRENIRALTNGKVLTVNNCHKYLDKSKNYIAGVRGHSLAIVAGNVQDHTNGRKNHITSLIELTPPAEKVQAVETLEDLLASAEALINFK